MKKQITLLALTILSYTLYGQEYMAMGIRGAGGFSTLKNISRSSIFPTNGLNGVSEGNRFAWDIGISFQGGLENNFFCQTDATVGMLGASLKNTGYKYGGGINKIDYHSFQSNIYLGKKIPVNENFRFLLAVGLYIDFHMDTSLLGESNTPEFIRENFKDWDFGGTLMAGFECGKVQFAINPQIGFVDLTRDHSRAFNRNLKFAITYYFLSSE